MTAVRQQKAPTRRTPELGNGSLSGRQELNPLNRYLEQLGRIPVPSHEENLGLARIIQAAVAEQKAAEEAGDPERIKAAQQRTKLAVSDMVGANLRLSVWYAKRYQHQKRSKITLFELIQAGNLALFEAALRFNPDKGFKFSTYAKDWLRRYMQDADAGMLDGAVRSYTTVWLADKAHAIRRNFAEQEDRELSLAETAEALNVGEEALQKALSMNTAATRLNAPLFDGNGATGVELLLSDQSDAPESSAFAAARKEDIGQMLGCLPGRQEAVLRLRFGIDDGRCRSRREIGQAFNLSGERIRQLEIIAFRTLRCVHGDRLSVYAVDS